MKVSIVVLIASLMLAVGGWLAALASHEKVEGWERVPGPEPENTPVWISPQIALTNADIARARPARHLMVSRAWEFCSPKREP